VYSSQLGTWKLDRKEEASLINQQIKSLRTSRKGISEVGADIADRSDNDDDGDTDESQSKLSLLELAENFMREAEHAKQVSSRSSSTEGGTKKRRKSSKTIDLTALDKAHYELYYKGPSESRSSKIHQLETLEMLDNSYHVDLSMSMCLLSHYLEHTREYRQQVLQHLRRGDAMLYLKFGTEKIPAGWCVLADRGFRYDSCRLPNFNPVIIPSMKLSRDQFEVEEIIEDIDKCRLRYTSEVLFSRQTDNAFLRGVVPVNRLGSIEDNINFSFAQCNLMDPLTKPEDWSDYICKYYQSLANYEEKWPKQHRQKRKKQQRQKTNKRKKLLYK